jgi:hypothetical protein
MWRLRLGLWRRSMLYVFMVVVMVVVVVDMVQPPG